MIPSYREEYSSLTVSGLRVPAAVTVPAQDAPVSAILLIPGSLNVNVDGDFPAWNVFPKVYAHLARQLAGLGHTVFRYSKSGAGTGSEELDPVAAASIKNWAGRMVIGHGALAEMRRVLREKGIEPPRTILAGHSEGAVVASLMAPNADGIDGVVLLSGPSVGLLEIMREQRVVMESPNPPEQQAKSLADFDAVVGHIRRREPMPETLRNNASVAMLSQMPPPALEYMHDVDAADPAAAIARVRQPVLIVQGGRDGSVGAHHADRLAAARGSQPTETAFFPELQHFYKALPDGITGVAAFGLEGETDRRVTSAIDAWIRRLPPNEAA